MKKKLTCSLIAILFTVSMAACGTSGVSDEEYQNLVSQNAALQSQVEALQAELDATPEPTATPTPTPTATPTPTPEPTPTPTPTPTPEPEMTEEEYKAACTVGYDYKTLARDPKPYIGKKAMFRGEVLQVSESSISSLTTLLVNVTQDEYGYWDDLVYVLYLPGEDDLRVLEDDIITMYGEMMDLKTYETVRGSSNTIPQLHAKYIDIEQ